MNHGTDKTSFLLDQGFDINHENIALLRLRNFTLSKSLSDEELMGPDALDKIGEIVGTMAPFVSVVPISMSLPYLDTRRCFRAPSVKPKLLVSPIPER